MGLEVLYSSSVQKIVNSVRTVDEEYVIRGDKGLKIKFYKVRGNNIEKIVITGKDGDYKIKKTIDTKVTEGTLDKKGLVAEMKSTKLAFAQPYIKDLLKAK